MPELTDLNALWSQQMGLALLKWKEEHFWYERTQLPPIGLKTSDYADKLIEHLDLSPRDSVLDIGCGDGAIAIRIARRVRQVSALDANPNLLFPITQRALSEGVINLRFLNEDWMEAGIGRNVPLHDIVLASRFRQIWNLHKFLEKMNAAARDRCYLTWIAEREEIDAMICKLLGGEYHQLPDYSIIVNVLESMGMKASVILFDTNETHRFESEEDAVRHGMRGYHVQDPQVLREIAETIISIMRYREGYWWKETPAKWALVSWRNQ